MPRVISIARLMLQVTMGRVEDPKIVQIFKMVDRSNDLYQAWVDGGSPGTWGNVQRRYKERAKQALPPATPAAAPQSAGGTKRSKARMGGTRRMFEGANGRPAELSAM
jgi:hypothetical protein